MNEQNVKHAEGRGHKSVTMCIRITPEISKWLREKQYSPTKIFYEALKDLKCPNCK